MSARLLGPDHERISWEKTAQPPFLTIPVHYSSSVTTEVRLGIEGAQKMGR